jgi:hypothetical protein
MTDEPKKNVHVLVPRGFQNRELLRAEKGISHDASDTPSDGECMKCKGTGAVPERVWLEDFEIVDGRIVTATPKLAWSKCRCYMGQFWIRFHPVNVKAKLLPKWKTELRDMLEQEKASLIRQSGGNYEPGRDTFLADIGYRPPKTQQIFSLDKIVRDTMTKRGDIPS